MRGLHRHKIMTMTRISPQLVYRHAFPHNRHIRNRSMKIVYREYLAHPYVVEM